MVIGYHVGEFILVVCVCTSEGWALWSKPATGVNGLHNTGITSYNIDVCIHQPAQFEMQ